MAAKKIVKTVFYIIVVALLLTQIAGLATATGELQGGTQGTPTRQATNTACWQTYVVKRGDTLSLIAERFFDNILAYNLIYQATNAAVGTDGFTPISDPNRVEPGQVLCIPTRPAAGAIPAPVVVTRAAPRPAAPITPTATVTPTGSSPAGQIFNIAPEEGVLLVENRADGDFVFDLTQPKPGSALVAPNHLQPYIVPAGLQGYMGHHPTGLFSLGTGQVQVPAGQITHLICYRHGCELASGQPAVPFSQQQLNQPVIAGQEPPPAPDNNNDNDNGNNNGNSNGNDNDNGNGNDNDNGNGNGNDNDNGNNNGNDNSKDNNNNNNNDNSKDNNNNNDNGNNNDNDNGNNNDNSKG